jgi:hypothetical protein
MLSNDVIVHRNIGEDQEVIEARLGGGKDQMGSKSSRSPSTSRVRVCLGVQEQRALKSTFIQVE